MRIEDGNESVPAKREPGAPVEIAMTRAAQEAQAAAIVAKRFPRDVTEAYNRIIQACRRRSLAEQSQYAYPRGGTKVSGPSIRLAEVLLQNWGNCESGIVELERREGESVALAYAWDLETNYRDTKVFTVPHIRERTAEKGGNVILTDPRDIYEIVANMGARRKRACMLAIVPGDIQDAALDECDRTMAGDHQEPIVDRIRKMVVSFTDLGVTGEMIEARLKHKLEATSEAELSGLRKIYASLKDGMSKREDWFEVQAGTGLVDGKQSFGFKRQPESAQEPGKQTTEPEAPAPPASPAPSPAAPAAPAAASPPAQTSAPGAGQQGAIRTLMQEIQGLAKEKGVKLQAINAFAEGRFGRSLVHLKQVELQAIKGKLSQHPKDTPFEA